MNREQYLNILILISNLESLILAHKAPIPVPLSADIDYVTKELRKEILK